MNYFFRYNFPSMPTVCVRLHGVDNGENNMLINQATE